MVQSKVIPVGGGIQVRAVDPSIGAILMDAKKITTEQAEVVLRLQKEKGLRFGEAAIQLGIVSQADVDYAVACQFDYSYLLPGQSEVSTNLVAAYSPFATQVESLRALRSQLMLRWFDGGPAHKVLALVSAESQEGRSFIASNLAVVFSQLGQHTLLIDADMRKPSQHTLFGLENKAGLSGLLSGRAGHETVQRVPSLRDLSVLPAGVLPPNPQELLARPQFSDALGELAAKFDVVLIDTPGATKYADAHSVAARAGGALIVVRKNSTRMAKARAVAEDLLNAKAAIVGTVINDF